MARLRESKSLCSKISGHSIIPGTSFRPAPESSGIYPLTRGRYLGSGFRRGDEYTGTCPIDAFDTGSKKGMAHGSALLPQGAQMSFALLSFLLRC